MKKFLLLTISLITFYGVQAQNSDYANRMQYVFGNIDQTKVTTGYLKEFGIRFANIEACNGNLSVDNFVSKSEWLSLYSSLYSMRVGQVASAMISPETVYNQIDTQQNNTSDILIAVEHYNYQQYKTNAHTNGDVIISKNKIYDVAGRNPYNTKTLFAITPLKQNIQGRTFTYKLPSNLVFSNSNGTLNQIQIDYGNGQGYQTVSLNQSNSITYNSGGEKVIKVKFSFSNGTTLESHSKIWLDYIAPNQPIQKNFDGAGFLIENGNTWFNRQVTGNTWNGSSATARVTIELAPGHTELTKPLIVIEGFDPDDSFNYFNLIFDFDPVGNSVGTFDIVIDGATGNTLSDAIEDEDYDLVFVDFENSTDFIQRNAYMVEEVIRQVNQLKVGSEKNVVLGMSMGGLVGRYALRHMEMEGEIHETKLYISHDAPHQGANVPLSAQAMVRHLVGEEVSLPVFFSLFDVDVVDMQELIPEIQEGLDLLNSPAAKQMLIYQLQGTGDNLSINNNSLFQSFKTEYSNMGYPQQNNIRNIAIANGSECGTPLNFEPFDQILDYNINVDGGYVLSYVTYILNVLSINPLKIFSSLLSTDTDIKGNFTLNALPSLQSKQIYRGRLYIEKEILWAIDIHEPLIDEETVNSSSNMLALDNAGGGIYDIEDFAELPDDLDEFLLQRRFSFIPTYSSLDVGNGNETITPIDLSKTYNPLSPPSAPKDVPFDNFFTNPITSEGHIQFTLNSGNWLVSELDESPTVESCSYACEGNSSITGAGIICDSSTFSFQDGPDSINWSIIPSNAGNLSSNMLNPNEVTVTINTFYNGPANLIAETVSARCDSNDFSIDIWLGKPNTNQTTSVSGPNSLNPGQTGLFTVNTGNFNSASSFFWVLFSNQLPNASQHFELNQVHNGLFTVKPDFDVPGGFYTVQVRATNACGFYPVSKTFYVEEGDGTPVLYSKSSNIYKIYPNPSSTRFNISLVDKTQKPISSENIFGELLDLNGLLISRIEINGNNASVNASNLRKGIYILRIHYDGKSEGHQVIVE